MSIGNIGLITSFIANLCKLINPYNYRENSQPLVNTPARSTQMPSIITQ